MRPQTDLLILLAAVIIINDSQTNPPDPAVVSHKLIWGSNSQKDKRDLY
jgi:hypothetical protein